ncbi:MAG: trehalose-6-phosphate synthase [Planctomycetota bacterium]
MAKRARKSDLVILANRLPVHRAKARDGWEVSPGGLVSALLPTLTRQTGVWVGWAGGTGTPPAPFEHEGFWNVAVELSESEFDNYYGGFSNRTLWPLYHDACRPPLYHRRWWGPYLEVNKRFAEAASEVAAKGAVVLVQDYHLQMVPGMLRELRPDLRIGFFLHIPFPPVELFMQLPWRSQLVEGLLGADVIGFQTKQAAQNFIRLGQRLVGAKASRSVIEHKGRKSRAEAFPISIDVERLESLCRDPKVIARAAQVRHRLGNDRKILLGVDRLDYTKGIDIRLRSMYDLLAKGTKTIDEAVLIQVSVPSREDVDEYIELRSAVEELVGQTNGEFSEVGRMAVHYLRRSLPIDELAAFYLAADVMLVTPLRDGMNLVAKEYVACRLEDTGSLVLSEFTGAAHELDRAILVNPHDVDGMAAGIAQALDMTLPEQQRRMKAMRTKVKRNTVFDWADRFVGALRD